MPKQIKAWALMRENGTIAQNSGSEVYGIFPTRQHALDVLIKANTIVGTIEPVTILFDDIIPEY